MYVYVIVYAFIFIYLYVYIAYLFSSIFSAGYHDSYRLRDWLRTVTT